MLPEPPAQTSRPAAATARNTGFAGVCVCDFLSSVRLVSLSAMSAWDLATLSTVMKFPTGAALVATSISCQLFPPSSDRCKLPVELIVQRAVHAGAAAGVPGGATGDFALSTTSALPAESCGSPAFRLWRACSGDGEPLCAAVWLA